MTSRSVLPLVLIALAALALACQSTTPAPNPGGGPATSAPASQPVEAPASAAAPESAPGSAASSTPAPGSAPDAAPEGSGTVVADLGPERFYTSVLKAWNQHETTPYLNAFADKLVCFHGKKDASHAEVKAARTRASGGDVVLKEGAIWSRLSDLRAIDYATTLIVDRGVSLDEDGRPLVHEKAVLMHLDNGTWKITGETPLAGADCLGVALDHIRPDPRVATCGKKVTACVKACPCKVASNGCESCKDGCTNDAAACMGITLE